MNNMLKHSQYKHLLLFSTKSSFACLLPSNCCREAEIGKMDNFAPSLAATSVKVYASMTGVDHVIQGKRLPFA
jgi:hypothetical protein